MPPFRWFVVPSGSFTSRGGSDDRQGCFPLQDPREDRRMVTGFVYEAEDVEVNLAVEGKGIHSVFLPDPRRCDQR